MYDHKDELRQKLADSFKEILKYKPVEKITVKMLTDKAGILRPTFYNFFRDKYEIIEWIFDQEVRRNVDVLIENELANDVPLMLFRCISKDKDFYIKTFVLEVPQSTEKLLDAYVREILIESMTIEEAELPHRETKLSKDVIVKYLAAEVTQLIKIWLESGAEPSPEELAAGFKYLKEHSISEILSID